MPKRKRTTTIMTAVFVIAQISIIALLLYRGRTDFAWSTAISSGGWLLYTFAEYRYNLKMHTFVRALMMMSIFFDAGFGYGFNFYETSFIFDKLLHIFGSYAFSLFTYLLVMQLQKQPLSRPLTFFLVLGLGMTIGTFYEILEFIGDHVSHPNPPNQPGLLDTDLDSIGDFIGATIAGIHASRQKFINQRY